MQAAFIEGCNCPCVHQTQIGGGKANSSSNRDSLSFNQYLTPLLAGLTSPYALSNGLSTAGASGILPQTSYSPYSLSSIGSNGVNFNTLTLLSLLLGTGLGNTGGSSSYMMQQPYGSSYRSFAGLGRVPSSSMLDVKL